ncbi:transaldolase/EF-hand domain-containing protein [Ruegeria denitrificans]|uniref:Transaldolase/EF-hand domain-containing protein n=1 Tax=Ruegeria denitrificans TaxID=1715692 RepID=A0A0P1I333_9RHOB|nr:EF-hand domain-containing protein [Ruegeria denitrificans]CUJ87082.1 transaldolase/EF-hand domain-containing protein [Ruegeria denitrificans]
MKSAKFIPAILISAVAITGTSVLAAGPRDREPASFQELDANGDGQLTQEELEAHRAQRFSNADTDGDGQLSVEEMQAAGQKRASDRATKMFEKYDANRDGFLSDDELPKPRRAGKMFDRIDADNSGTISEQEYADAKERMGRKHKKHGKADSDDS